MAGIFRKLRKVLAMMLACMMLVSSVASAAPVITLPSMTKAIEDEAFKGDTSIENVVIPDGATSIGEEAFADCTSLQTVTIPDSVSYIGENAFSGCDSLIIICSSTSYAAEYAAERGIETQLTDAVQLEARWTQHMQTIYSDAFFGNVVASGELVGYDEQTHGEIVWSLDRIDENGGMPVDFYLIEKGANVEVRLNMPTGETGKATWRLSVEAGEFTDSFEFTVNVEQSPDDLPTGVSAVQTHFEIGETLDFSKASLYFNDGGYSMDEEYVYLELPGIEEMPIWTENEAQYTENGFSVTFTQDGRYVIPVYVLINNALFYDEIVVTAGTGVVENAYVTAGCYSANTIFCDAENLLILGDACLNDFPLSDGEEIVWSIESVNGEGLIELYCENMESQPVMAFLKVASLSGETGTETFRVTASVGGASYSETFDVILIERPETLPTDEDVLLETDVYHFNVGDTFEFYYSQIGLDETNLPDGMSWHTEVWNTESSDELNVEYTDEKISVTFDREGTHTFYATVVLTADYSIGREFTVIVGDGVDGDQTLVTNVGLTTMYLQDGDDGRGWWLADFGLENYSYEYNEPVEWNLEILEFTGDEPAVNARIDYNEENPWAGLVSDGFNGSTGSVTFRVHCIVNGMQDYWTDVEVTVEELPENRPTDEDVQLETDFYQLNVGETLEFKTSYIGFDESILPEGMSWSFEIHNNWLMEQASDFEWTDEGFRATFIEDGRFVFRAVVKLGANLYIGRDITVIVGTGVSPDFSVEWSDNAFQLYKGGHDAWVTSVYINAYTPPAGTNLEWNLTLKEGQENPAVEPFFNDIWDDGEGYYYAMINANQMTEEPGEAVWILTATAGDEVVVERELTLSLVEYPEDLVIDVAAEQTEFYVECGERFTYSFDNISRGENFSVPEDAAVCRVTYTNENFWNNESFTWVDGGFEITFDEPGRYMFETGLQVNNVTEVVQIVIIVGEGPELVTYVPVDSVLDTFEGNCWFGNVYLHNFYLHDGEEIDWRVELVTETDAPVAELYISDTWDNTHGANLNVTNVTGGTGEVTYRVVASGRDGKEYSDEITIYVADGHAELPGEEALTLAQDTYELSAGTEFSFTYDDFSFDDSTLPEGCGYIREIWGNDKIESLDGAYWDEDGAFHVTFHEAGRYWLTAVVRITADYCLTKDVAIIVDDGGLSNAGINCNLDVNALYPAGDEDTIQSSYELIGYNILPSDEAEWTLERYTDEYSPEVPAVELYISWMSDERNIVDINARAVREEYVTELYILTCWVNGEAIASTNVFANVTETPENLPAELWVEGEYFEINPWDEFFFTTDMFDIADGDIPENVYTSKELWVGDEMWNGGEFEWFDGGFRFVPYGDGVYPFAVAYRIGNYTLTKNITLVAGSGMDTDYSVDWEDGGFTLYKGHGEMWVTNGFIHDYILPEGWQIDWNVYRVSDGEYQPLNVWISHYEDYGRHVTFNMNENGEEAGEDVWRIEAVVNGQIIAEREITVYLADLPEDMPTELWVDNDDYYIEVGDEFVFTYDMFDVCNGAEPEGVYKRKELWIDDYLGRAAGFENIGEGFRFVPETDGRYSFEAAVKYGSYIVTRRITVTVGTGVHPDFSIEWNDNSFTMYKDCGDLWVTDVSIRNYAPPAGCDIEWRAERVTENENQLLDLCFVGSWDNNLSAGFHANPWSDESGEEVWRIVAQAGDEIIIDREVTITLTDLPAEMPGEIWVDSDDYYLEVGQEFVFDTTMFGIDESLVPEGAGVWKEIRLNDMIYNMYGFDWADNGGFYVKPDADGRYNFTVAVSIGNYWLERKVTMTVGTGVNENSGVDWNEGDFVIFRNCDENYDSWVMDAHIHDYAPPAGCEIEWYVERVSEDECQEVEAYINNVWDDGLSANVSVRINAHELGEDTWRVIAHAGDEVLVEREFTITVLDLPEDIPTELWVEEDTYYINPGDEFYYYMHQFGLANGNVPEGVNAVQELWADDGFSGFEWVDNGFRIQCYEDATYRFSVAVRMANYVVSREITIIIGEGEQSIEWNDNSCEMYKDCGDLWVADLYINGYELPDGSNVEWQTYRIDGNENQVVELYAGNPWNDGFHNNIMARQTSDECGENTWRVVVSVDGEVLVERDFTIYVVDAPEGLPTGEDMWVECEEYQLNVGDTFGFNDSMFGLNEGFNEDEYRKEIHSNNELEADSFYWTGDNAFNRTFNEDGRYTFRAAFVKNNYIISREVRILVGTGVPADAGLALNQRADSLYLGEGLMEECGGVDIALNGYTRFENESIEWNVVRTSEGEEPAVEAFIGWISDDQLNVGISFRNISAVGEETFEVTASTDSGAVYSESFTMTVTDDLSALPIDFDIGLAEHYEIEETYLFNSDCLTLIGGAITADDVTVIDTGLEVPAIQNGNGCWWDESGLNVQFFTEDVYEIKARLEIANYVLEKNYYVTVGDGVNDDWHISCNQFYDTCYTDGTGGGPFAYLQLENYSLHEGETIEWTLERVDGSENNVLEVCFGDPHEYGMNFHVRNLTGEEGWAEYRITGTADRYSESRNIWVQCVNRPDNLPTEIALEADVFELQVGEQLKLDNDFWVSDGEIPENAYVSCSYELSDRFCENAYIEWMDGSLTATMNAEGRYVITACMEINNYRITRDIIVVVGSGVNDDMALSIDQSFTAGFNFLNTNMLNGIAIARLDGYQLASGEQIRWSIELIDPADGSALPAELSVEPMDNDSLSAYIFVGNTNGLTGSVTYQVTARTEFGQQFTENITFTIIEEPETLPTEMTGVETEVMLDVGDTYVVDPSLIGFDGEAPEGVECCLEFWNGIEYLEWLPGFVWREDGGFEVTFNRDGYFEYRIVYRFGANYWVYKDVAITIGEGIPEDVGLNQNLLSDYLFVEEGVGSEALAYELYMQGYEPYEGENILWHIECIDGDPECVGLYISEIRDNGCTAQLTAFVGNGKVGEACYLIYAATESGYQDAVELWVCTITKDEYDFAVDGVYFDDITIPVGEDFDYFAYDYMEIDGDANWDYLYCYLIVTPEELLEAQDGFERTFNGMWGTFDGFRYTPSEEGRYNVNVEAWFGNVCFEDSFILTVGDGIPDDADLCFDQMTETIYVHGEQDDMLGVAQLVNVNLIGDETARWTLERIDENEGTPVEIYLSEGRDDCSLYYTNIQSAGSVTYRLTVDTDAGFTDSVEFTLNVEELPEDIPTALSINLPTHYEIGDTMDFVFYKSVSFADGVVPENARLREVLDVDGQVIWNENEAQWNDDGFSITFTRNGRYQFNVIYMISNYPVGCTVDITVGTGVSDDAQIGVYLPADHLYINQGDSWLGNFYLHNYILLTDETVEWTLECIEGNDEAGLYLDSEWDGGLGVNLNSAGTGEACGWSAYRLTGKTAAYEEVFEFGISVDELPEGMPTELIGEDEIFVLLNKTFEFNADCYVQPEWEVPDGNYVRYIIDADESVQSINGFGWMNEGWFLITPNASGVYTVTVRAQVGNYILNEKQITLIACLPNIELYNAGSVVYSYYEQSDLWVANASLANLNPMYDDEVEWTFEPIIEYNVPSLFMYMNDTWDDNRSVSIFAGYEGSWSEYVDIREYRLTARIGDVFEESVELTVTLAECPDDMPYCLDMGDTATDVQLNVGDTYTFDSSTITFAYGTVPDGAFVHDEIWGLEEDIERQDDFSYWENNMGVDGVGFSVTFNEPGRYNYYVAKYINNMMYCEEIRITVGDVPTTELPLITYIPSTTLYTDCEYGNMGWIELEDFKLFDSDYIHCEVTRITDENSSEEPVVQLWTVWMNGTNRVRLDVGSTGTATGTETYRVALMLNDVEAAATEITLTVVEKPEGLPENIIYSKDYQSIYIESTYGCYFKQDSPSTFKVRLSEFSFSEGVIPEDAVIRWELEEYHDEQRHTVEWHEDGGGLDLIFFENPYEWGADAGVNVYAYINNYKLTYWISIGVDGGSPK